VQEKVQSIKAEALSLPFLAKAGYWEKVQSLLLRIFKA